MSKKSLWYVALAFIALGLYSCSATKYVPDGEYLLDKLYIKSDIPNNKSLELKPYVRQQPNSKMFNLNKTRFQLYNLSGRDSTKWVNRFLKKAGEDPVIFDPLLVTKTESELRKLLFNKGYVNAKVDSDIVKTHEKKVDVTYHIVGNEPYRVWDINYKFTDRGIEEELIGGTNHQLLQTITGEPVYLAKSYLNEGMLFDRNILENERVRITTLLHNRGYFDFDKNSIRYEADTSRFPNTVDLTLILNKKTTEADSLVFEKPYEKYYINRVEIYLDYAPLLYSSVDEYPKKDSIIRKNRVIYYRGDKPSLRPSVLANNCFIMPGDYYSQYKENLTYSSFASLSALNNIHIQYREVKGGETPLLDCIILTIPSKKKSISFSIEGTNTSGDLGVASSANYTHRNLFKGAETFNLRARGAYEAISNLRNPYLEFGIESSITVPKFLFPYLQGRISSQVRTLTEFSLSYNTQSRPEYDRNLFSGGVSYIWQNRNKMNIRHQFDLLDIDYIYLPRIDSEFLESLPTNAELFGYTDQFIVGMSYSYYNSTFDPMQRQRSARSFRFSLESAGNALYGVSSLMDRQKDENGLYRLFNNHFAQFVKGDIDYSRTVVIDRNNSFAFRVGGGIGFPYGNSKWLPFEKRYYSGGANSVRGWSVRELGPGKYVPNGSTTFFHQSGDIRLDMNAEYRSRFFWKLEAAAFIDAGNIWTIKNYEGQEGGQFKFNSFYKEIALSYGIGLRLDFDFFLVRFDCGWKAYDPSKRRSDAWAILHPNFTNNFAWHIAVGYPF